MPGYGVLAEDEGRGLLPWSWAEERLAASRGYWIATVRPDGRPHVMPVWGIWLDGAFWFGSSGGSRKVRNLAAQPRCVVTIESTYEPVVVEGIAEQVTDGDVLGRVLTAYNAKYGVTMEAGADPYFVVRPKVAFAFIDSEEDFAGSATRWSFAEA